MNQRLAVQGRANPGQRHGVTKLEVRGLELDLDGDVQFVQILDGDDAVDRLFNSAIRLHGSGVIWANLRGFRKNSSAKSF